MVVYSALRRTFVRSRVSIGDQTDDWLGASYAMFTELAFNPSTNSDGPSCGFVCCKRERIEAGEEGQAWQEEGRLVKLRGAVDYPRPLPFMSESLGINACGRSVT